MNGRRGSFEKRWVRLFADNVSKKDLEEHVLGPGNCIWHVFSWELLPSGSYLESDAARAAYDNESKEGASFYEPWTEGSHTQDHSDLSAAELDELTECCVISADGSWTYIKTHERDLGPYFYRKN